MVPRSDQHRTIEPMKRLALGHFDSTLAGIVDLAIRCKKRLNQIIVSCMDVLRKDERIQYYLGERLELWVSASHSSLIDFDGRSL